VGIPDKVWGEGALASIDLNEGAELTEEEVVGYCKEHLADFKCPRKIEFADAFPKTATGKIQKNKIVKQCLGET